MDDAETVESEESKGRQQINRDRIGPAQRNQCRDDGDNACDGNTGEEIGEKDARSRRNRQTNKRLSRQIPPFHRRATERCIVTGYVISSVTTVSITMSCGSDRNAREQLKVETDAELASPRSLDLPGVDQKSAAAAGTVTIA